MVFVDKEHTMLGFERLVRFSPDIFHFTTTRRGGCSQGNYASMNCTHYCGDEIDCVRKNKELLLQKFPESPVALLVPHQTHGTGIMDVDEDFLSMEEKERNACLENIDALITDLPGYCLCVSTADCVPVLLYDPSRKVVAAVHAGWRGTVSCILYKTLMRMKEKYGCDGCQILAGIGPSISGISFEVGDEVYEAFKNAGFPMERLSFRHWETSKWHIDLWEANRLQLMEAGVPAEQIELAGICTYQNPDLFFSARRLGSKSGRILTGIQLNASSV